MQGAAIDREVSKCQDFFYYYANGLYISTTNLIPSVSRAKLAYTIKTIPSIIRPPKTLNYIGYKMNQVS